MSLQINNIVYSGTVKLVAGRGVKLSATQQSDGVVQIVIQAQSDSSIVDTYGIKSINNIKPDDAGNIKLTGIDCVKVVTGNNSVIIEDACSTPCCKDTDQTSQYIASQLNLINLQQQRLLTSINGMISNINYIQSNLVSLAGNS